jgi:hypothetical protein
MPLDTHCGRKNRMLEERPCRRCGTPFMPRNAKQRYCSRACGFRHDRRGQVRLSARKVQRPPLEQLRREVAELGYRGTGQRYGVSDNAVRKWLRAAERAVDPSSSPASP